LAVGEVHEAELKALFEAGDLHETAARTVEVYGPEVLALLIAILRSEQDGSEAFAEACADLWAGLDRFGWRCSMRTWFYTLARHAAARLRRAPDRRPGRAVPLSQVSEVADRVRTQTLPHLRTAAKDGLARIRESLDREDQLLLILRVDRQLGWADVARVMADVEPEDADGLRRAAARLRKRFQLLKDTLRRRAIADGLLDRGDP
jgi:RNA polymerase sigma-70 factor (ECF subfamily)